MNLKWILISASSGGIAGGLTYLLTGNWKLALLSSILVFVIVLLNNPKRRYLKAFYIVLIPLACNTYFTIDSKTENFNIQAGLKELDIMTTLMLGLIALLCLALDYLERSGKLKEALLEINRNSNGNITGNNIHINQKIHDKNTN